MGNRRRGKRCGKLRLLRTGHISFTSWSVIHLDNGIGHIFGIRDVTRVECDVTNAISAYTIIPIRL